MPLRVIDVDSGMLASMESALVKGRIERIKAAKAGGASSEGMVFVKGGCFQMGDTFGDGDTFEDGESDEKPVHEVCLDDFEMDKTEVTQSAYESAMGKNPSKFKGGNNPVEKVNWDEAKSYCEEAGKRLPTEAEWEYAAKSGGKKEKYAGTSSEANLSSYAWYYKNSGSKTHPVGKKKPNGLGLYDMSGNVYEWVSDWYDQDYYKNSPRNNPKRSSKGEARVLRGGSWSYRARIARTVGRGRVNPAVRVNFVGFRCARAL